MQANIRTSELVLDRVLNPTDDEVIGTASGNDIVEACGLIPDFFCQACLSLETKFNDAGLLIIANSKGNSSCSYVAYEMDSIYGCGGFQYSWSGTLTDEGVYQSNDEDPDMNPLALFRYAHMELFVYQYGVCAIRDTKTNESKIARFD